MVNISRHPYHCRPAGKSKCGKEVNEGISLYPCTKIKQIAVTAFQSKMTRKWENVRVQAAARYEKELIGIYGPQNYNHRSKASTWDRQASFQSKHETREESQCRQNGRKNKIASIARAQKKQLRVLSKHRATKGNKNKKNKRRAKNGEFDLKLQNIWEEFHTKYRSKVRSVLLV